MSIENKKHVIDWWTLCPFWMVVKFLNSIYPRVPTMKDKITFWKQHGSYQFPVKKIEYKP